MNPLAFPRLRSRAFLTTTALLVAVALSTAGLSLAADPASAAPVVSGTIPVGSYPYEVAVDPGTHTAYVDNYFENTVSVIDEATNSVTGTITVGNAPYGVAVDPLTHMVYVTNAGDSNVSSSTAPLDW